MMSSFPVPLSGRAPRRLTRSNNAQHTGGTGGSVANAPVSVRKAAGIGVAGTEAASATVASATVAGTAAGTPG